MKYFASLFLIIFPAFTLASVQSNISVSAHGGSVHVESNTESHDVQIQNVQVVNGRVEVESTVDGKSVKTVSSPSGSGGKTTVTIDGVTRVFEGALPTNFATVTADGTKIQITGDTVLMTSGSGKTDSYSKIQLSNEVSAHANGTHTVSSSRVKGNAAFASLVSLGAISADPSTVTSDEDLSLFVANVLSRNSIIDEASFGSGSVSVSLHDTTKLFGIIPMNRTYHIVTSNVDGDSDVAVSLPWWNVFASKPVIAKSDAKAKLSADIKAAVGTAGTTPGKEALALATIANTLSVSAAASEPASGN